MKRQHHMPFGAEPRAGGAARFRLWAPDARRVTLHLLLPPLAGAAPAHPCARAIRKSMSIEGRDGGEAQSAGGRLAADLNEAGEGWFELEVAGLAAGAQYCYRLDDELDAPDPASRFNAQGVPGPSTLVDPASFEWSDERWRGRSWNEAVVYEMHVGAFTPAGTYAAAGERLDELAQLGVTAIELMPLAAFPGKRGWGYDGVGLFAPHEAYGAPDDLKRFVQAAHERNLMVLLDVVYNHFGPQGNYLPRYASGFFTAQHRTPWGDAINFAHPTVRRFFIENALYWLNEHHFDGLRIDAVHAMHDDSRVHFIDELIETVQAGPGAERNVHVVLENHRNEARRLRARPHPNRPPQAGEGTEDSLPPRQTSESTEGSCPPPFAGEGRVGATAQWNDDFHHALHVIVTGERDGYYVDYADRPIAHLGRVLAQGFAYQGERSAFSGEPRGEPSADLPPTAFVNFLQNHDQIGNRAFGERIAQLAGVDPLRAAYAVLLLAPQIPMVFMGGEYAASQPFLYFCDYQGELADAIRTGRREEFAGFNAFADERALAQIPDPNDEATFIRSRLDCSESEREPHAQRLAHVRSLLSVRAKHVVPRLADIIPGGGSFEVRENCLSVRWPLHGGAALVMCANLGATDFAFEAPRAELIHSTAADRRDAVLSAWEVRLLLASP